MQVEAQALDGVKGLDPEKLLVEDADEALGDTVALGLGDEDRVAADAQEAPVVVEVMAHDLRAVVMPERDADSDVMVIGPEVPSCGPAQRLEGLVPGGSACDVNAQALGGAVVPREEDGGGAVMVSTSLASVPYIWSGRSVVTRSS